MTVVHVVITDRNYEHGLENGGNQNLGNKFTPMY